MEIGISTVSLPRSNWIPYLKLCKVDSLEINPKTYIQYRRDKLEKYSEKLKDWKLSIHTNARPLFTKEQIFDERNIAILKSEILAAKILNADAVIFHMPPKLMLSELDKEFNYIQELINFSKEQSITLYLENNSNNAWSDWKELKQLLKRFPELKFCLDIGNLRTANENNTTNINEFIEKLGIYAEYIHIHNAYGPNNLHSAIDNGSLNVIDILNKLPKIKRIIIEMVSFTDTIHSLEILRNWIASLE
jgi:sugar phosphate isomerase/epimerase